MSSVHLLDKTRKIGQLLHNNSTGKVIFNDICHVMSDMLSSKVMVLSRKGKVLGTYGHDVKKLSLLIEDKVGTFIDSELDERFLAILSTKENIVLDTLGFDDANISEYRGIVTPIVIGGKRFGTLFMYKSEGIYDIDDIILSEYGATVVGLEMLRSVSEERDESDRMRSQAELAMRSLSVTEKKSIGFVFDALDGNEGMLVASNIAKESGITRSVIVNALRKLESAGVIETRSAGMKGTYVKILNIIITELLL